MDWFYSHLIGFIGLLFIVNPLSGSVFFTKLTEFYSKTRKKRTARIAAVSTFFILLFFSITGHLIFELFRLTLAAFQIAGGIIIFSTARGMTQAQIPMEKHIPEETESAQYQTDISIVPLATPMLAGPGAITAVILNVGHFKNFAVEFLIHGVILALICLLVYFSLTNSDRLLNRLGPNAIRVMTRLMGILIMAISVQYILNGVKDFLKDIL